MTLNGLPLHPLVVHAAVVLVPLAALAAAAFTVPRWRWAVRWPAAVAAIVAALSVQLAAMTGEDLQHRVGHSALIETHERWAGRLQTGTWVFAAVVLVAFVVVPYVDRGRRRHATPVRLVVLERPLLVALPVLALAVLVLCVLTGDAGARAVWASQ